MRSIDASLYYSGTFEEEAEAIITDLLEPGMVAIDIGANFGYHTFRMSRESAPTARSWPSSPPPGHTTSSCETTS